MAKPDSREFDEAMGKRLKARRLELGLTLRTVATRTNLSIGFLSDLENCKRLPSSQTVAALCICYGVTADWVLFCQEN